MKRNLFSRTLAILLLSIAVLACTSNANSATTTVAPSTTSAEPSRTTVPWQPGAAVKAWNTFIKQFVTVDVSGISKSDCGVYAMLITEGSLTFYMWNGVRWMDISSDLGGGKGAMPLKVYTHDFTNDGALDFFVTYGDNRDMGGSIYGAYFAFPWSGDNQCKWSWVDTDNGQAISKIVDRPDVDQRNGIVYAGGFTRGYGTYGKFDYLPSTGSFVFTEVFNK
jgi:hypothetical protein